MLRVSPQKILESIFEQLFLYGFTHPAAARCALADIRKESFDTILALVLRRNVRKDTLHLIIPHETYKSILH
jgi:hypothetical protein